MTKVQYANNDKLIWITKPGCSSMCMMYDTGINCEASTVRLPTYRLTLCPRILCIIIGFCCRLFRATTTWACTIATIVRLFAIRLAAI